MVPYGPVRSRMALFGPILSRILPYGHKLFGMILYGLVRSCMVPYSPLWSYMVLYGPIWPGIILFSSMWSHTVLYSLVCWFMVPYGLIYSCIASHDPVGLCNICLPLFNSRNFCTNFVLVFNRDPTKWNSMYLYMWAKTSLLMHQNWPAVCQSRKARSQEANTLHCLVWPSNQRLYGSLVFASSFVGYADQNCF